MTYHGWMLTTPLDAFIGTPDGMTTVDDDADDAIHVHPINDTIDHRLNTACPCGPTVELHNLPLVVHHSLDGREALEHAA